HAATGEEDCAELVDATLDELERAVADIGAREVARAKAQMRAGLLMTLESPSGRAGQLARHVLFHGRPIPLEELVARIDAVTPAGVRDLLGRALTTASPTLSAIGPIRAVPGVDAIARRL